jgi:hypothetical protein
MFYFAVTTGLMFFATSTKSVLFCVGPSRLLLARACVQDLLLHDALLSIFFCHKCHILFDFLFQTRSFGEHRILLCFLESRLIFLRTDECLILFY